MHTKLEHFDPNRAPRADRWNLYFCGACPNGHVVFFDARGTPLAHATMTAAQARTIMRLINANDPNFREENGDAPTDQNSRCA